MTTNPYTSRVRITNKTSAAVKLDLKVIYFFAYMDLADVTPVIQPNSEIVFNSISDTEHISYMINYCSKNGIQYDKDTGIWVYIEQNEDPPES